MKRVVQSELLDELAADDPRAIHSRRDLRRINAWMGNARIAARALQQAFPAFPPRQIVEIGAGDGVFLLSLARRLSRSRHSNPQKSPGSSASALLVDRQGLVKVETKKCFAELNWKVCALEADVFDFFENDAGSVDVVVANLFLHHFSTDQLNRLFQFAGQKARVLIAVEPRRSRWALLFSRLLWMIGCNRVTRHDAVISVRAGFAGRELSALWPEPNRWRMIEQPAGNFSHLFVASRKN